MTASLLCRVAVRRGCYDHNPNKDAKARLPINRETKATALTDATMKALRNFPVTLGAQKNVVVFMMLSFSLVKKQIYIEQ